ncbi:putative secreted protein with PEP-CTERM sorting signal [Pseudoduganella flava]|uniref:PEP-CTERM sorting domain-containing protein n=1 Tax=Pseudoduganella flava TaxID=871742 RepID=A0A562PSG9_9BURK|nr:PEP-CTERM sorting domain-containing protein [Pseudoduganella flava]QGZ39360.1 PEP-CTERM sorting domain-containing protein [Pseudoduganella flava]TWI47328.1 putative secreted protein with PEP-CTERM sorting signal [Pseudoduganella flava]
MKLTAFAAAVALALPLTAFADVTATSHIGNFHFEVIDLDLNDGVTASLMLDDGGKVLMAGYYPDINTMPDPLNYLDDDGTVTASVAAGSATATLHNGSADASATFGGNKGEVFGTIGVGYSFTLTANTKVILYADGTATGGIDMDRTGTSHAAVFATYYDGSEEPLQIEDFVISATGNTASRGLSVTFSSGADGLDGELGYSTGVYAGVSAVPEPSQVALMTLGLAGLGWRLRRSKHK